MIRKVIGEEFFIMVIDSHAHVMHPPQRQLELMAETKVDRTVLFTTIMYLETATSMKTLEKKMVIGVNSLLK